MFHRRMILPLIPLSIILCILLSSAVHLSYGNNDDLDSTTKTHTFTESPEETLLSETVTITSNSPLLMSPTSAIPPITSHH